MNLCQMRKPTILSTGIERNFISNSHYYCLDDKLVFRLFQMLTEVISSAEVPGLRHNHKWTSSEIIVKNRRDNRCLDWLPMVNG